MLRQPQQVMLAIVLLAYITHCTASTTQSPTDCGNLSTVANSEIAKPNGSSYPSTATYICNAGYDPSGNNMSTCQADGTWTDVSFSCTTKDCGNLSTVANIEIAKPNGTSYPNTATYTCDAGYNPTGNNVSTCQANGTWTDVSFSCTAKDCGNLSMVANSEIANTNGSSYPSSATYTCNAGYDPSGNNVSTCQSNGTWTNVSFSCTAKDCVDLSTVANSEIAYTNGSSYTSTATYTCNAGYDPSGNNVSTCQANGTWADVSFSCTAKVPLQPLHIQADASANNATILIVKWIRPEMYTGPTQYIATAVESESDKEFTCTTGDNYNATNCTIYDLEEYWMYDVSVTAVNKAGNTTSNKTTGRTSEDVPKAVTDLAVEPERNVTRKRSMTVTWKPPRRRERNGIITKYVINYMDLHKSTTLTIEINVDSVVNDTVEMDRVIDVLPGTYFIQVTAATSKGLGESSGQNITVDPGAPPKTEANARWLILPAAHSVSDKQTQIAVQLSLTGILCNVDSGLLTLRAVIVAGDNEAMSDTQFYGTKDDFNRKMRHTYKSWFAVNNLDSIPPYIATPSDWKPNCASTSGNRKRRATTDESMTYIIGEQGDCEGVSSQGYCNGELQPGRTYRVKTVACTAGGCTESSYSEPISTESDSTAVVVIVVTIVILLMAAGGAGVVLYIMRIRRKALKYEEMNERHKEVELKPTAEAPVFRV